jgi:HEAT repeat protein
MGFDRGPAALAARAARCGTLSGLLAGVWLALPRFAVLAADELEALRARLRSADKWTRAEAVEELARAGTEEALELVVAALADPKGEVADAAQVALAGLEGPEQVKLLEREGGLRAREPLVRARAAEILGRLAFAPAAALQRALGDEEAEVRRMGAWSIQRQAAAGRLDDAARCSLAAALETRARSERDVLARTRALAALAELDPPAAARALEGAWRDRDPLLRAAAAALAATIGEGGRALERLRTLAADPAASVRRVALEALAAQATRAAASVLVERLGQELEERMVLRLVEELQRLSGLKHRRDPRPWSAWLATLPEDWKAAPKPAREEPEAAEEAGARTSAAFAGLPIVSARVAILIDLSGSIWSVRPDGRTRKQVVDGRLREALGSLPSDTRFNLIPYTGEPIPWKERLVNATPAHVKAAASWFEGRRDSGSGNLWDAVLLALEDPEVDTLLVLFDGAPTGGTRHRLELIAPLFLERNWTRRVALDLVLVDASKKLRRLWGELARATGGRVVSVSL